jgi:hypothetical protein
VATCFLISPYPTRVAGCTMRGAQSHPDPGARLEWLGERPDRSSERSLQPSRGITTRPSAWRHLMRYPGIPWTKGRSLDVGGGPAGQTASSMTTRASPRTGRIDCRFSAYGDPEALPPADPTFAYKFRSRAPRAVRSIPCIRSADPALREGEALPVALRIQESALCPQTWKTCSRWGRGEPTEPHGR